MSKSISRANFYLKLIPAAAAAVGSFATQSETIEVHYPELSVARTAVLDYFQSPSQNRLEKIFSWEDEFIL